MNLTLKKKWGDLSFDELVKYHSIERGGVPTGEPSGAGEDLMELMVRMQEFEVVSGLEVMGVGVEPLDSATESRKTVTVEDRIEWLERELEMGGSCVWMKSRNDNATDETVYVMPKEKFVRVMRSATEWMQKKEGLLKLPEKYVVVNGETFALPTLVGNDERVVRYGQYGDMQIYMTGIMRLVSKGEPSSAEWEKMRMYRNGFLATLLLPTVVEKVKVDDVREKDGSRWMEKRMVRKYDRGERERVAEVMDGAPGWLFSMLWHLVQSCLAYYQGRFPDLVSGSGGKTTRSKNTDMYVAKLGTDNVVMKYAGYPSVEAVNDEPVGVILERLDAMNKESKEWERMRKKK